MGQSWRDLFMPCSHSMGGSWTLLPWKQPSFEGRLGLSSVKWLLPATLSDRCKTFHFMRSPWWVLQLGNFIVNFLWIYVLSNIFYAGNLRIIICGEVSWLLFVSLFDIRLLLMFIFFPFILLFMRCSGFSMQNQNQIVLLKPKVPLTRKRSKRRKVKLSCDSSLLFLLLPYLYNSSYIYEISINPWWAFFAKRYKIVNV